MEVYTIYEKVFCKGSAKRKEEGYFFFFYAILLFSCGIGLKMGSRRIVLLLSVCVFMLHLSTLLFGHRISVMIYF